RGSNMQATLWKSTLLGSLMVLMAGCSASAAASNLASRVHAFTNPPTANQATSSPSPVSSDVQAALQAVVKKANDAQQQAFSQRDPSTMKDISTDDYYQQMVEVNTGLAG